MEEVAAANSTDSTVETVTQNATTVESEVKTAVEITVLHTIIGSLGIVTNMTVVVALLNHKTYRKKVANIFIINQVNGFCFSSMNTRTSHAVICLVNSSLQSFHCPSCRWHCSRKLLVFEVQRRVRP